MKTKSVTTFQVDKKTQTAATPAKRIRSTREELARMEKELAHQVDKGNNTITLLIKKTGWSRQAINRRLALMVARGQLQMIYRGRGTYYVSGNTYVAASL